MDKIRVHYAYLGCFRDAGGEAHPLTLAQQIDADRFDFQVTTFRPNTSSIGQQLRAAPWPVHELDIRVPSLSAPVAAAQAVRRLVRHFRATRPHIVQTQSFACNLWASLAAELAGVPLRVQKLNFDEPGRGAVKELTLGPLLRHIERRTTAFVAVSPHLAEQQLYSPQRRDVTVIAPPFRPDRFLHGRPAPTCPAFEDHAQLKLGIVGRLSEEKGHETVLKAMPHILAAHPHTRLTLVGDGPLRAHLETRVAELGLRDHVTFAGHSTDVCNDMCALDLLLVPSRNEAFGIILLEAAAVGLPIVASRSGSFPQILEGGGYGTLVDARDPAQWAKAVIDLAGDPASALDKAQRAQRALPPRYTAEAFVTAHERLYERLYESL